jgi:hypothetical protein
MKHRPEEPSESNTRTHLEYFKMDTTLPLSNNNWDNISAVSLPTKYKQRSFDNDDLNILMQVYKIMFPKANILSSHLSRIIKMYTNLNIFGVQYGSKKEYRSQKMSGVLASWRQNDGQINEKTVSMAFGSVDFYFTHSLLLDGEYKKYCFACVTWYTNSEDTIYNGLNLLMVVKKNCTLPGGPSRFLPIQRISTHCSLAMVKNKEDEERYIVSSFCRPFL